MAEGNRPSTRLRYLGRVAGHVLRTAIGHLLKLDPPDVAAGGFSSEVARATGATQTTPMRS
jgi:hypothetical protein